MCRNGYSVGTDTVSAGMCRGAVGSGHCRQGTLLSGDVAVRGHCCQPRALTTPNNTCTRLCVRVVRRVGVMSVPSCSCFMGVTGA